MAKSLIQVCGDPTVDWLWVHNEEFDSPDDSYFWLPGHPKERVSVSSQPGGSALILQFLREMIPNEQVDGASLDAKLLSEPKDSPITRSWTTWKAFNLPDGKNSVFRLAEWNEVEPGQWNYRNSRLTGSPDLLIVEDSGLGFRDHPDGWPRALDIEAAGQKPEHIILKLAQYDRTLRPERDRNHIQGDYSGVWGNDLVNRIVDLGLGSRTTVLTSIKDLRSCAVKVSVSLSWEKMLEEVVTAVYSQGCPFVYPCTDQLAFERVIVTIGASGTIVVEPRGNTLIFDRTGQEGDFARRLQGDMMGYNTCMVGVLAKGLVEGGETLDWSNAVLDGLGLARLLHLLGYKPVINGDAYHLTFPAEELAANYRARVKGVPEDKASPGAGEAWNLGIYEDVKKLAREKSGQWSILEETAADGCCDSAHLSAVFGAVCDCARRIVTDGPKAALANTPIETVGNWRSADRHEIEGVRSVGNALRDYLSLKNTPTPLNVAVFGPPGSGKSFAVNEIAKDLKISKEAQLTFNLSQFESPHELAIAFHEIRDLRLKGHTPLVFWDEFDSRCEDRELGWLRHFLAPMQDGEFTDQGRVHPIGPCIFVFAGATRYSFDEFCAGSRPEDLAAKLPDFVSRLRTYIDVRGPNGNPNSIEDRMYVIRRAFMLNHYLQTNALQADRDQKLQVEDGVLDAFIKVSRYRHGARSMETIVKMSNLAGKRKYELSSLPPDHVLRMHVNADHFTSLTQIGHREMLRVGITGHMSLDPIRSEELRKGVEEAVKFIRARYPDRTLTVFSPMAKGSDRLVARELLKTDGASLIAVLPVPQEDYVVDFGPSGEHTDENYDGAELRQEFHYWLEEYAIEVITMGRAPTRNEAYQKAGYFVADHSDVMVTVWDGLGAQGTGGTAEIVARATEGGKPVCHVWADNYKEQMEKRTTSECETGTWRHTNFAADLPDSIQAKDTAGEKFKGDTSGYWSDGKPVANKSFEEIVLTA